MPGLPVAPSGTIQGSLFDAPDDARWIARMKALDAPNARYGRGTVTFASMGRKPGWKLRTDSVSSPRCKTAWDDLLTV